jgi:uncharacterized membrane protein (UPF0127 family)
MNSKKLLQIVVGVIVTGVLIEQIFIPQFFPNFNQKIEEVKNAPTYQYEDAYNEGDDSAEGMVVPISQAEPAQMEERSPLDISMYTKTRLMAGKHAINVMIASTDDQWTQGLSGAASLARGEGMWFAFNDDDVREFWMPDMNFAIDIIFVDHNNVVLNVEANAEPETNLMQPKIFRSAGEARYVLEVPAGDAARMGIVRGMKIYDIGLKDANSQ